MVDIELLLDYNKLKAISSKLDSEPVIWLVFTFQFRVEDFKVCEPSFSIINIWLRGLTQQFKRDPFRVESLNSKPSHQNDSSETISRSDPSFLETCNIGIKNELLA